MTDISIEDLTGASLIKNSRNNEILEKYQSHFAWLRDTKFLQDLENDSIDSDIIEEELSALQEEEVTISKRKKIVKFLQSNPVQIILCVVVLLDAVIVIAQILLDLNSVKNRLYRREEQLERFLNIVRIKWGDELHDYRGHDVENVLSILEDHLCDNMTDSGGYSPDTTLKTSYPPPPQPPPGAAAAAERGAKNLTDPALATNSSARLAARNRRDDLSKQPGYRDNDPGSDHTAAGIMTSHPSGEARSEGGDTGGETEGSNRSNSNNKAKTMQLVQSAPHEVAAASSSDASDSHQSAHSSNTQQHTGGTLLPVLDCSKIYHKHAAQGGVHYQHVEEDEHDVLHEVAHGLHFASVAFLGFLVLEDLVKIIAMGLDFFRHKIEIFDAIIIVSSFIFDIVFLGGVTGEEGKKAAGILIILLLWRIARVVDGILVTVKQRQEFRIRLQKRSRRTTERKIDMLEDERHCRLKHIQSLKELCTKAGVKEEDIDACTPRRGPRRVSTTMCALSSVARLSVSMTMSMSSGLFSLVDDDTCTTTDDNAVKPPSALATSRYDRRFSSNSSKGREYLGPYDTPADCYLGAASPKPIHKKRSVSSAPSSPGLGPSSHEPLWLPKVPESSLEACGDGSYDSVTFEVRQNSPALKPRAAAAASGLGSSHKPRTSKLHNNSLPLQKIKSSAVSPSPSAPSSSSNNTAPPGQAPGRSKVTDPPLASGSVDIKSGADPHESSASKDPDSRLSSPENSCGVQIVIDEGSEQNSNCSHDDGEDGDEGGGVGGAVGACQVDDEEEAESETQTTCDSDSFLTVSAAFDTDRRASGTSQIFLLSELR